MVRGTAIRNACAAAWTAAFLAGGLMAQPPGGVQQARFQPPSRQRAADSLAEQQYQIQLDVPSMDRVFRLENDQDLFERIRQEYRTRNDRAIFPAPVETDQEVKRQVVRNNAPQNCYVHPSFVVYNPLYFEDLNVERYGWELGVLQPLASTLHFYKDVVLLPYNAAVLPPWACDANAGYYNVGQPVPYICYVPPWSWKGAVAEVGTFVGGASVFP